MSISFSGLGSGLDTASWVEALVSVKQEKITQMQAQLASVKSVKNTLTSTKATFNTFRSSLEKLTDAKFGGAFDLFTKNEAKSSDSSVFTAVAEQGAAKQSYDIVVNQLATCTKATSLNSASSVADTNTKLKSMGISNGSLTVYVDGVKNTVNIDDETTLGDLETAFTAMGITTTFDSNGIMTLAATNGTSSINIGANNDTTNFRSIIGLNRQDDGTYQSMCAMYKATTSSKLTDANAGFVQQITAGTFKIGDAEFTIDNNTTLSSLISDINNNASAQAKAHWDDVTGKLVIESTQEGASYINIEAGSSNFTDVMGFTLTTRDADNDIVSSIMYTDAQDLGLNAILSINGTTITSASNNVSSDVSRISGVTINLNKISEEDDFGVKKTSKLEIGQKTDELIEAVKSFVSAYNDTIAKIDEVTASGADLQRETSLTSFKNSIRTFANSKNEASSGVFKLLSDIGISTGKADASNLSTDFNKLEFDEDKFMRALEQDPDSVKEMLAGENGIIARMENAVEQTLQSNSGFFDVKTSTLDSDIRKKEEKITKQKTKITAYQAQLETKFQQMEDMIAKMQQNYSSFLG